MNTYIHTAAIRQKSSEVLEAKENPILLSLFIMSQWTEVDVHLQFNRGCSMSPGLTRQSLADRS